MLPLCGKIEHQGFSQILAGKKYMIGLVYALGSGVKDILVDKKYF